MVTLSESFNTSTGNFLRRTTYDLRQKILIWELFVKFQVSDVGEFLIFSNDWALNCVFPINYCNKIRVTNQLLQSINWQLLQFQLIFPNPWLTPRSFKYSPGKQFTIWCRNNQLTAGKLLSNDRQVVSFSSSQLRLKDATILEARVGGEWGEDEKSNGRQKILSDEKPGVQKIAKEQQH